MRPAIRVENLSKCYRVNDKKRTGQNLSETIATTARTAWDKVRQLTNPNATQVGTHEFWALKDVSFEVKPGEVVGIIGRNGAGKSTLLKILSQIVEPSSGYAEIDGRVSSLLEVGTGFHPELTGRENVYLNATILGMSRKEIAKKFDEIVDFSGVEDFLDTPVKRYSSGMYVRLAFAVAAHLDPEVMIVDEVLAVGDAAFQAKCIDRMSMAGRSGTTVLYVSHNLASVQKLCGRCCYIANGRMVSSGDTMEVINSYLGVGKLLNKREFEFGPVRTISMIQHGNKLDLDVDYYAPVAMSFVNLGFIVSDIQGVPLFGTNTRLYNIERFGNGTCGGRVNVTITSPVLLDGMYLLSVWFGDDKEDVFGEPHCLQFEVQDMSLGQRQPTTRENGHIAPTCQWKLTGA